MATIKDETKHPEPTAKPPKHAASPQSFAVSITAAGFTPPALDIKTGDSVCWTNNDNGKHSVKFADSASGRISPSKTFEKVFDTAGTFEYACESHPAMRGTITVA